jgi:formylglycine-generating enzyme required for sulfatase activity
LDRKIQGQADRIPINYGFNPSWFVGDPDLPVESLTWYDATNYSAQLTDHERLAGRLPAGYVFRLPTEAEWEYAARAGTTPRFSYGDDPGYLSLTNYAWYSANSGDRTHPVGLKQPNPWGLYDVYGNVEEWCLDWYGNYSGGAVTDPKGPPSGPNRVIRGGSHGSGGEACQPASRGGVFPENWDGPWGLRVVLALNRP